MQFECGRCQFIDEIGKHKIRKKSPFKDDYLCKKCFDEVDYWKKREAE